MKYLLIYLITGIIVALLAGIISMIIITINGIPLEKYSRFNKSIDTIVPKSKLLSVIIGLIIWPRQLIVFTINTKRYIDKTKNI